MGKLALTDAIQTTMVCLAEKGMPIKRMCWYCGIGERTYYDWIRRGDLAIEPYAAFVAAIRRAQAERTDLLLDAVTEHAIDDPMTARWLLSRSMPKQYGKEGEAEEEDHTQVSYGESTEEEITDMFADDPRIQAAVLKKLRAKKLEAENE